LYDKKKRELRRWKRRIVRKRRSSKILSRRQTKCKLKMIMGKVPRNFEEMKDY